MSSAAVPPAQVKRLRSISNSSLVTSISGKFSVNKEAKALEDQGADILVLATNTMHKLADQMMAGVSIPLLHIAEVTAQALIAQGLSLIHI